MKTLAFENISVRFGSVQALRNVSLEMNRGESLMLIGPNGAGKSTLMKVLLGLVKPNTGQLLLGGQPQLVDNRFKETLGYLPEAVAFSENLSARQVLRFFARARAIPFSRIEEVLERVGLSHAAGRKVRGYSRGMRQRLGLGISILAEPEILILDEPTGGLDQMGLQVLWSILEEWKQKERMVFITTHDLALLERRVDRICILREGELLALGTSTELREKASLPHRVYMQLQKDTDGALEEMKQELAAWQSIHICKHTSSHLEVTVGSEDLLDLFKVQSQYIRILQGIRVEEPTLDKVYEKLLEV